MMNLSIVKLFPDNLVNALCNTLIHSLWQGLVLAAITGIVIVTTRRSSPARRYNLLIGAIALFAITVAGTFIIELGKARVNTSVPVIHNRIANNQSQSNYVQNTNQGYQPTITENISFYLNRNASTIVLIWFMIMCARCLQLATGLQGIYYLRRRNVFKADVYWEERVQELSRRLGINRLVSIVESGLAKTPMVIGHLKPLILVPVGMLAALSAEEVESILVHELAHIRRADYLVNLLQSLMEIVFFFNPAVLWISSLIKAERENCCDDIAIAQSSNKVTYIKALVSCQEFHLSSPAYAMALNGKKGSLKGRVTRILSNSNQSLNRMEKALLAVCLICASLFTAAFTNAEKIDKLVTSAKKAVIHKVESVTNHVEKKETISIVQNKNIVKVAGYKTDSIRKAKVKLFNPSDFGNGTIMKTSNGAYTSYIAKENGTFYQLNYLNDALASMQINGKAVPAHDHGAEVRAVLSHFDREIKSTEPSEPTKLSDKGNLQPLTARQEQLKAMAIADSANRVAAKYKAMADHYQGSKSDSYRENYPKEPVQPKVAERAKVAPVAKAAQSAQVASSAQTGKPKTYTSDKDKTKDMINDLVNDGLIKSKDNLSFKISTEEFIVNGKKQPDAIYQKYRAKYVNTQKKGSWSWFHNFDTSNKSEVNETSSTTP